jgi:hypothetical protein
MAWVRSNAAALSPAAIRVTKARRGEPLRSDQTVEAIKARGEDPLDVLNRLARQA